MCNFNSQITLLFLYIYMVYGVYLAVGLFVTIVHTHPPHVFHCFVICQGKSHIRFIWHGIKLWVTATQPDG